MMIPAKYSDILDIFSKKNFSVIRVDQTQLTLY